MSHAFKVESKAQPTNESGVFSLPTAPSEALWRTLDNTLREVLAERAVRVTMRDPSRRSPLDAVAMSVVHCRHALAIVTARADVPAVAETLAHDRRAVRAIMCAYRFCTELANELVAIEALGLTDANERAEAAAFVPFALRSFDELVLPLFDAVESEGYVDADDETRAFMWDMGSIRLAITRAVSALIAVG